MFELLFFLFISISYFYGVFLEFGTVLPDNCFNYDYKNTGFVGVTLCQYIKIFDLTLILTVLMAFNFHYYIVNLNLKIERIINLRELIIVFYEYGFDGVRIVLISKNMAVAKSRLLKDNTYNSVSLLPLNKNIVGNITKRLFSNLIIKPKPFTRGMKGFNRFVRNFKKINEASGVSNEERVEVITKLAKAGEAVATTVGIGTAVVGGMFTIYYQTTTPGAKVSATTEKLKETEPAVKKGLYDFFPDGED